MGALTLNGHAITGQAEALIVLRDGARLTLTDAESGFGAIRDADCAIRVQGSESRLAEVAR